VKKKIPGKNSKKIIVVWHPWENNVKKLLSQEEQNLSHMRYTTRPKNHITKTTQRSNFMIYFLSLSFLFYLNKKYILISTIKKV